MNSHPPKSAQAMPNVPFGGQLPGPFCNVFGTICRQEGNIRVAYGEAMPVPGGQHVMFAHGAFVVDIETAEKIAADLMEQVKAFRERQAVSEAEKRSTPMEGPDGKQ